MISNGNIMVLTQWSFKDALVQTYTLPYVAIIRNRIQPERKIILVTAEQERIAMSLMEVNQINETWLDRNMKLFTLHYRKFSLKKIFSAVQQLYSLYRLIKKENIKTIHAFCTPAGSIGYLLSKLTGARLIIDSYEPHAEAMVENGTWKKNGPAYRVLFSLEKKQSRRAAALIATTAGMKQYALEKYGVPAKEFFVKPACVDLQKFFPVPKDPILLQELGLENKIVCVYAGKLGGIYYQDEVFDFIHACYEKWGDRFRFLLLTNAEETRIQQQVSRTGLSGSVVKSRFVFHNEIPRYLSLGDFAINPVKPVPTKRYCTSIKDGEYWAMGLPVVISPDISDDSSIIEKAGTGVVMDFADKKNYFDALARLDQLLAIKEKLKKQIRQLAEKYRTFEIAGNIYTTLYGNNRIN